MDNNTQKTPEILIIEKDKKLRETGAFILTSIIFGLIIIGITYFAVWKEAHAQIKATESIPIEITPPTIEKTIALPEPNEIINLRTEKTQTFQNNDGTQTLRLYTTPIFTKDLQNNWLKDDIISLFGKNAYAYLATQSTGGDSQLRSAAATTNYGTTTPLYFQGGTSLYHIIQKFTLPNLTGYTIVSASIKIKNYTDTANFSGKSIEIHQINAHENWQESEVTWNKADISTNWTNAGGDYSATIIDSITPTLTNDAWNTWDIQGSGATNPLSLQWNTTYSFLYKITNETSTPPDPYYLAIRSEEDGTAANRPYMEITYQTSPPTVTEFYPLESNLPVHIIVTGTNFTSTGTLSINGTVLDTEYVSSTIAHADIPTGENSGYIVYTNDGGTATSSTQFIVLETETLLSENNKQLEYLIIIGIFAIVFTFFDFMRRTLIKK